MTQKTDQIQSEINALKAKACRVKMADDVGGYNMAMTILTDLLGCIFIGCAVGFFLQFFFQTSVLLTAGLTLMGGIAGLYTTARYALRQERKHQK